MVLLSITDLSGIKIAYHYCTNKNNYKIILWDKAVTHLLKAPLISDVIKRQTCGDDNYDDAEKEEGRKKMKYVINQINSHAPSKSIG